MRSMYDFAGGDMDQQWMQLQVRLAETFDKRINGGAAKPPAKLWGDATGSTVQVMHTKGKWLTTDGLPPKCSELPLDTPCPSGCNCSRSVDLQEKLLRPWSDLEKCIFLEQFLQYPKKLDRKSVV